MKNTYKISSVIIEIVMKINFLQCIVSIVCEMNQSD